MRHDIEARGVDVTHPVAMTARETLTQGKMLAATAAQYAGGVVRDHVADGVRRDLEACPSRLPALSVPAKAARVAELLRSVGLGCVLVEDGAGVAEGWAVDVYDPKLIKAVRAYIEANSDALRLHGFKPPEKERKNASGNIAEWLIDRLEWLGIAVVRGPKVSSSQQARGKRRACTVTRATVLAAWVWAKRPYEALTERAEDESAGWAVAVGGR